MKIFFFTPGSEKQKRGGMLGHDLIERNTRETQKKRLGKWSRLGVQGAQKNLKKEDGGQTSL